MIIAHDSSSKWKWAVRWKIKKTSLKINKTVHWSWKFQVKISIYINLGRFSLFIGRFYLWLVNKSEAKTKKVFNYKISIRFQRTKDSNLSSKGMKRILKKKQKLMIFIFKTFSAIQNQIKNSKDWRQHGKEPARQGIYELTTQGATRGTLEQFMNPLFQRIGLQKCDYIRATTPRDYHTLAKADNILPWMK